MVRGMGVFVGSGVVVVVSDVGDEGAVLQAVIIRSRTDTSRVIFIKYSLSDELVNMVIVALCCFLPGIFNPPELFEVVVH